MAQAHQDEPSRDTFAIKPRGGVARSGPSVELRPLATTKALTQMSVIYHSLRAFAAGAAVCCAVYGALAESGEISLTISDFTFQPDAVRVPIGTKIVWENNDDTPHSIVETTGKFHSPALDTEDKFSFTFDKAGSYEYFCGLHPHMKGKVVVTP
jgi:plastocyanin